MPKYTVQEVKNRNVLSAGGRLSLEDKLKNAKDENKKTEKNFFNSLLNICLLNGLVDWSDKDPKKEFADIGRLVIIYMNASGIEVEDINKVSNKKEEA